MGIAVRNPVTDDANILAIVSAVSELSGALALCCAALHARGDDVDPARLERCRLAVGHLDRAAAELRGDVMRATAPLPSIPSLAKVPGRDPRLPPDRYHP